MRLRDALRIVALGKDRDGRMYFRVTEPHDEDDDESDGEDDDDEGGGGAGGGAAANASNKDSDAQVPRILAESASGEWGEVTDLAALRLALGESHAPTDTALRHKLPTALAQTALDAAEGGGAAEAAEAEKPLPAGFSKGGHEWIGARVRLVSTRDGYEWHDGHVIAWAHAVDSSRSAEGGGEKTADTVIAVVPDGATTTTTTTARAAGATGNFPINYVSDAP